LDELKLKYGCNPHQKPARIFVENGALPVTVLNGEPGYINFLDALNAWQLVRELKAATGLPAAASFKHVSPAGAALGLPLSDTLRQMYAVPSDIHSPLACAYARARGADRLSAFGDWAALSDICDAETARLLQPEVSDGVIAPGYTDEALSILRAKRSGRYNIVSIDAQYQPPATERKEVFGITFEQRRNDVVLDTAALTHVVTKNAIFTPAQQRDLLLCLITLKYTQSNSVCYAEDGQIIGVGAGQQSRIHCTRLAGDKADLWHLRQHPRVLALPFRADVRRPDRDNAIDVYLSAQWENVLGEDVWAQWFTQRPAQLSAQERQEWLAKPWDVCMGSDAFFPFGDNIERAHRSGVRAIAQPGGSIRDGQVIDTCDKYNIAMAFTGVRLFHH
jgi:phosphoribosylaminoimidazolecarboxamide formyltransferase/IMP cyclohydrolase